jgi:hypothetical protein
MDGDQAALPDMSLGDQMDKNELSLSLDGVSERTDDVSLVEDEPNGNNNSLVDDLGEKDLNSSVAVAARIEEENSVDPFDDELEKLLDGGSETTAQAANIEMNGNGESVGRGEQEEESNLEEVPMEEELFLDESNASAAAKPAQGDEGEQAEAQQEPTLMITEAAVVTAEANDKEEDDELAGLLSDLEGAGDEEKKKQKSKRSSKAEDEDVDFDLGEEGEEGAEGEKKDETRAALLESIFGGDDDDDDDLGALLGDEDAGGFVEDEKKSGRKKKSGSKRGKRKADSEDSDIEKKTKRRLEVILQQKDEKEKKKQRGKKRRQSHADAEFDEGGEEDEEVSTKVHRTSSHAVLGERVLPDLHRLLLE